MNFYTKIFLSILLTVVLSSLLIIFSIYFLLKKDIENEYYDRYKSLGEIVANTFQQMEVTADSVNKNALVALSERLRYVKKIPSDKELDAFAKYLGITSFYVIDAHGKFLRSSDLPIKQQTNSLFSYSKDYAKLIYGNLNIALTPIIPSFPLDIPAKFTMAPNHNRTLIIESGTQLQYISQLLHQAVVSDKNIESIGIYAPTGFELGSINSKGVFHQGERKENINVFFGKKIEGNNVFFTFKIPASVGICPECVVKGVSKSGEYFYILKINVSLLPLLARLSVIKDFLFCIFLGALIVSIVLSRWLSKKLVSRIHKISQTTKDIMHSGNLDLRVDLPQSADEVSTLAQTFNEMIESLKNTQNNLIAAEKSRGMAQLATQVAHDIRSPLLVLTRFLPKLSFLSEKHRIEMRNAVQRVTDIANNLLSQYIQNKDQVNSTNIFTEEPVVIMAENIISEKRIQVADANIDITLDIAKPASISFVYVDFIGFKRMLSNLLNNAIDAIKDKKNSNEKGLINVSINKKEEKIIITIKDNGCGISQDKLEEIIKEGGSFNKKEGMGLGLSYSIKKIIEWNGFYNLKSEVNVGTEIEIILPEARAADWFRAEINVADNSTIVILDDDHYIHQIWNERFPPDLLKAHHIKLVNFDNPQDFINFCNNKQFENTIFLLDYELKHYAETGFDLAKKFDLGIYTTLVTSRYEDLDVRLNCKNLGMKLIPKSFAEFIPIKIFSPTPIVFIDDEKMLTEVWEESAKDAGKTIKVFNDPRDFMDEVYLYPKDTLIYIDSSLGELKGEDFAKVLFERGYQNIILASGYDKEYFKNVTWVKDIVGKEPPWG